MVHDGTTARAQVVTELCRSDRGTEVTSSGPYLHVASHVTDHVTDDVTDHVTDVTDHVTDVTDHVMDNVTTPVPTPPVQRRRGPLAGFQLMYRFEMDPVKQDLPANLVRE